MIRQKIAMRQFDGIATTRVNSGMLKIANGRRCDHGSCQDPHVYVSNGSPSGVHKEGQDKMTKLKYNNQNNIIPIYWELHCSNGGPIHNNVQV